MLVLIIFKIEMRGKPDIKETESQDKEERDVYLRIGLRGGTKRLLEKSFNSIEFFIMF